MKNKRLVIVSLIMVLLVALVTLAMRGLFQPLSQSESTLNLVQTVRKAAEPYKDVAAAEADGYGMFLGCVSGAQEGAMGVHYPNGSLVGDGALDPNHPEVSGV
jgi:hypothetical protein